MKKIARVAQYELAKMQRASITWFIGRMQYLKTNHSIPGAMNPTSMQNTNLLLPGEVIIYTYDAKTKDTLPYWDKFPLTIVLDIGSDSFLGLNLHYLPLDMRIAFFNQLLDLAVTPPGTNRTRLKITYQILKMTEKFHYYVPCIKRYLADHVVGRVLKVQPHEWLIASYLPTQQFQKAQARTVWSDSKAQIRSKAAWKRTKENQAEKAKQDALYEAQRKAKKP